MSGRKSQLTPYVFTVATPLTTAGYTSQPTNIEYQDNVGVQLNYTSGDSVGNFQIQISADYNSVTKTGNWVALFFVSQNSQNVPIPGNTSPLFLDLNQLSAPWIRVVYTGASGSTSLLTGILTGKQV